MKKILAMTLLIPALSLSNTKQPASCTFKNLYGECPTHSCWARDILMHQNNTRDSRNKDEKLQNNRMIIHGGYGNGKTTLAKNIANASGSNFEEADGKTLRKYSYEQGFNHVQAVLDQAIDKSEGNGRVTVVLFDEIDEMNPAARDALRNRMDEYQDDRRLFIIATAKNMHLGEQLIPRF